MIISKSNFKYSLACIMLLFYCGCASVDKIVQPQNQVETVEKPFFNGRNPEKGHMPRRGTSDRNVAAEVLQQSQVTDFTKNSSNHSISFIWPLQGRLASSFGAQKGNVLNKGIDIRSHKGAVIVAAAEGKVVFCADNLNGYGKVTIIEHGHGFSTVYAHNQQLLVQLHQSVKKGERIAACGNSGRAQFPQLHFEIRKEHIPQNPLDYLPR